MTKLWDFTEKKFSLSSSSSLDEEGEVTFATLALFCEIRQQEAQTWPRYRPVFYLQK